MERKKVSFFSFRFFQTLDFFDLKSKQASKQASRQARERQFLTAMLNATQPRAGRASDARIAPRPSPDAATSATTDCAARALPAERRVVAAAAAVAALAKVACFFSVFFVCRVVFDLFSWGSFWIWCVQSGVRRRGPG